MGQRRGDEEEESRNDGEACQTGERDAGVTEEDQGGEGKAGEAGEREEGGEREKTEERELELWTLSFPCQP